VLGAALGEARRLRPVEGPLYAGTSATGSCGGVLDVTSEHENGVTDYVVTFQDFCVSGEQGDMTWDGVMVGKEIGTPSDSGPVIKAFEMETQGAVQVVTGAETVSFEIAGARADYGDPQAWYPGTPTEEKPNVVKVDTIEVTRTGSGETYTLTGLHYETVGAFLTTQVEVVGGMLEGPNGSVRVRTEEGAPLAVMLAGGSVNAGGLVLQGAKDTEVIVAPVEGEMGVVGITVNGAPYADRLDCADALGPTAELVMAVAGALPIY